MEARFDERRVLAAEIRATNDEGILEGRAAPFNTWTPIGGVYLEQLTADTFRDSVTNGAGRKAPLLLAHARDAFPVGKALAWDIREDGLHGTWQVDMGSDEGRQVYRLAKDGFISGLSVGFQPGSADEVDESSEVPRVTRGPAALREVSVVPVAAYEEAQITLTRSAGLRRAVDPRIAHYRELFNIGG